MKLVTGGNGFIGSHLVQQLIAEGERVRVLDLAAVSTDGREFVQADLRDLAAVQLAAAGCGSIFHQAALVSVPESVENPPLCHEINVTGTLNVLLAARDARVQRVVVASSSAVYGNDPVIPKREALLPAPASPYAASKLAAEELCQVAHSVYGLETVALRYFNVYGPGQSASSHYAAVIPKFIEALVNGKAPVLYGDGEQTRDFIFVEDVVRANLLAAEASGISGQVFNVGSGVQTSLNDLLEVIAGILGVVPNAEYHPAREGDVRYSVADISKARSLLEFDPSVTLEDGLRRTIQWFLQTL